MAKQKTILLLTSFLSLLPLVDTAFAMAIKSSGVYLEGNIGYAKVNEEIINADFKNDGFGWNVNGGYKFNPNFALEIGAVFHPDVLIDEGNYSFDLAAKGIIPTMSGFSFFGKLGLAMVHHNVDHIYYYPGETNKPALLVGIGIGYAITEHWEVTLQSQSTSKYENEVPAMALCGIGLTYIF